MKKNIFTLLSLLLILNFSFTSSSLAADQYDGYFSSEMILNLKGKPGDILTETVRFFNDTAEGANVSFSIKDFIYEEGTITYEDNRPESFSVQKWTTLNVNQKTLESKGFVDIELTVKIPGKAEMGEHMALLGGTFIPTRNASSQMKIATEISPVVYVLVTDQHGNLNLNKDWNLLGVKKDVMNGGNFIFTVENKGNVHLESNGTIKINNLLTSKITESKIPRVNLLPKNKKDIIVNWEKKDLIGLYKAEIDFSMDGERFESQKVTLYVIPWVLVGVLIGSLVLLIVSVRLFLKRLKKKWISEAVNQSVK
jgi:hypothetical protein